MPRNPTRNSNYRGWAIVLIATLPAVMLRDLFHFLGIHGNDAWLATAASVALLFAVPHVAVSALDHRTDHASERGFECQIADLCRRDGLLAVQVDPEANVKAYLPNGSLVLIRCGPTDQPALAADLHHFIGTAHHEHQADIPVFVTVHGFTHEARRFAAYHGIALIDRPRLGQWQQGHGLAALVGTTR
jgi:hypothetical protein